MAASAAPRSPEASAGGGGGHPAQRARDPGEGPQRAGQPTLPAERHLVGGRGPGRPRPRPGRAARAPTPAASRRPGGRGRSPDPPLRLLPPGLPQPPCRLAHNHKAQEWFNPPGGCRAVGRGVAETRRVAVLVSGHGSNLQALLDAAADPGSGMAVVLVAADRRDAFGLERARRAGIDTAVVRPADHPDRPAFDLALRDRVAAARPDVVCLAGFMRILGPSFVRAFPAGSSTPTRACCRPGGPTPSATPSPTGSKSPAAPSTWSTRRSTTARCCSRPRSRSSPATTRTASTDASRPRSTSCCPLGRPPARPGPGPGRGPPGQDADPEEVPR